MKKNQPRRGEGAKPDCGSNKGPDCHPSIPPFAPSHLRGFLLSTLVLLLALPLTAQEAPEPEFDLIGSTTQKFTLTAPEWSATTATTWAMTIDLKPQFTFGPVSFQADSTWTLPMTASLNASSPTVVIPEAYFRLRPTDSLDVTFGQKRFSLGVGQTFTVGDSLNPVIGFFDQKTGFRGATAEWSPVSWASVSGAVSTEKGSADAPVTAAVQTSLLLDQVQITASAVGRKDATFNPALGLSYDLFGFILTAEGAAEFLPQGVRPSGLANTWKAPEFWSSPAVSASAGARWALTLGDWDLTLAGEYLHWAQGWTADETDAWKAALKIAPPLAMKARAALPLRSQENAFLRVILATGGVFSVTGFAAVDLQDQSLLGQGSVVWTPWDDLDLVTSLQAVSGQTGTSWEYLNPNKDRYQASLATTYHF